MLDELLLTRYLHYIHTRLEEFQNMQINPGGSGSPLPVNDLSDPGATPAEALSESYEQNVERFIN